MEMISVIKDRRSIRRFTPDDVSDEMIRELLEAASLAPSSNNCQPWRFVVVKNQNCKEQLAEAGSQSFVKLAPLIIVACIDRKALSNEYMSQRKEELIKARSFFMSPTSKPTLDSDMTEGMSEESLKLNLAIAIDHLTLRAVDLGLGTCWVMRFDNHKVKEILSLDDQYEPLVLLPVGFPNQQPKPRPRLEIDKILIRQIN